MSDDNNSKSRGPRKGGGAGGRGGGRDGGFGHGEGRGPARSGAASGGERKPFRARSEGGERPSRGASEGGERPPRRFDKPAGQRDAASRPPREGGERPFRARPEGGERPFRARPEGERSSSRPPRDGAPRPPREGGERPFRARAEGGERPFRARPDGERSSSRPPREGGAPSRLSREGGAPRGRSFGDRDGGARSERPRRPREDAPAAASDAKLLPSTAHQEPERIAKVMARAGVASRRECEAMIAEGRVSVNGTVLESPALDVGPKDVILVDGEPLPERERTRMWLYHKPRGLVTTNHDPEGRTTVFESLPEELPRVLSIGRLDINTEGLLLLTNDGGLARMLELPETGWLRRYRVRAFGSVTQDRLDSLRDGVTIEGVSYGPVVARFERQQGSNTWLTVDLREGKNREVKTVLEHLGLDVNRLIRVSFGPFQLGDLPEGEVDELRSRVLRDQLGEELMAKAGVDLEAPRRDEMPAAPARPAPSGEDRPRRREGPRSPSQDDRSEKPWKRTVWRDAEAEPQRERKAPPRRGADPKLERQTREAAGQVERKRDTPIADPNGRRVLVERVRAPAREERPATERRPDRKPRAERGAASEARSPRTFERSAGGERPPRRPRDETAGGRDRADERPWQDRAPRGDRPERAPRDGAERPARRFSERSGEERGGDRPPRGRNFGDKPGGAPKSYAARSSERPAGRGADGERSGGKSFGGKSFGGKPSGGRPAGGRPFGGKPSGGGRPGGGGKGPRPGGGGRGKRD